MSSVVTIPLPPEVEAIYKAVKLLEQKYPHRKFTPDGHLVGSIGEVIAAEYFNLDLLRMSHKVHDAKDKDGNLVQIKLTAGNSINMSGCCSRLIVMRIKDPKVVTLIYDGDGTVAWEQAGKPQKNGQCNISLKKLQLIADSKS